MATIRGTNSSDKLDGTSRDDVIYGFAGNDILDGAAGDDTLYGDAGNDSLSGGTGINDLFGGSGNDRFVFSARSSAFSDDYIGDFQFDIDRIDVSAWGVSDFSQIKALLGSDYDGNAVFNATYSGANHFVTIGGVGRGQLVADDCVFSDGGARTLVGTARADTLFGSRGDDLLQGRDGADDLLGGVGDDRIFGDAGDDHLYGGAGRDTLTGGSGADYFIFSSVSDSAGSTTRDRITDFTLDADTIDLSDIDANVFAGGNQAFRWIDTDRFGAAGELRFAWAGNSTIVYGNTDDDAEAEFAISLAGNLDLIARDFVL